MTAVYSLTVLGTRSLKSGCHQDHAPSKDSRGGSFLDSPSFWWLLEFPGLKSSLDCIPLVSVSIFAWTSLLSVSLHLQFLIRTLAIGFKFPQVIQDDLILRILS